MANGDYMMQTITLEFANGETAQYTGPAISDADGRRVVGVTFSEPMPLPPDCIWGNLGECATDRT